MGKNKRDKNEIDISKKKISLVILNENSSLNII